MKRIVWGLLLAASTQPAVAEVKSTGPHGFEVESRVELPIRPAQLYHSFGDISRWWSDDHTYSGKAVNLSLDLRSGGCWCEKLAGGGGVEHMRVAYVEPYKRIVLTGSLGPLLAEATTGVMQITIAPTQGGSSLVMNYRVAGFHKGGAARLAPLVDQVLAQQMTRLRAYAGTLARQR